MMLSIRHIILGAIAASLAFTAATATAGERNETPGVMPAYETLLPNFVENTVTVERYAQRDGGRRISASQAKSAALRSRPGSKFVNIQMSGNAYRVRLQEKNGRIIDVYVDARTGRVKN